MTTASSSATDTVVAQTREPSARIGERLEDLETPCLIVELAAFERNLERMARAVAGHGMRLRPHAKCHKCPAISLLQIAAGAIGICCQKVSEAEAFVRAGIGDVLVTNEVVGTRKLARLAALAVDARIGVLVDDASQVEPLGRAAVEAGVRLDAYVELDVGAHRCGVDPGGDTALAIARAVAAAPGLRFAGLQAYHGPAQHVRDPQARAQEIARAAAAAAGVRDAIVGAGIPCAIVTGAGSGSFVLERDSGVYNELQPGSYVFMDADYARNARDPAMPVFEHSLFVWTAVMSCAVPGQVVVDAGLKASSVDSGMPVVHGMPGLHYARASDEHGVIEVGPGTPSPRLGHKLKLVPGHCDPTVNLYDWLIGVRDGVVECVWPVTARGALA